MGVVFYLLLLVIPGALESISHNPIPLNGSAGRSVQFPALSSVAPDIVRIIWFSESRSTHIAQAMPRSREYTVNYLPDFKDRLAIHTGNLSLEMRELRLEDSGLYRAVVDMASEPTVPKTFTYQLSVQERGTTAAPATTGRAGGITTPAPSGEASCHCAPKGYLVGAVYGSLTITVIIVHIKTRN